MLVIYYYSADNIYYYDSFDAVVRGVLENVWNVWTPIPKSSAGTITSLSFPTLSFDHTRDVHDCHKETELVMCVNCVVTSICCFINFTTSQHWSRT